MQELLLDEGILESEIALDDPRTIVHSIEQNGKVAGFFAYSQGIEGWTILDHFVIARWARNTTAGARLWHALKKHMREIGVSKVLLNLKIQNVKLSLFLQNVLHAIPYRIDDGKISMILEV